MNNGAHWVSIAQASERLGLSCDTIERLIADGDIPSKSENDVTMVAVPIVVFVPGPQNDGGRPFISPSDHDGVSPPAPAPVPPIPSPVIVPVPHPLAVNSAPPGLTFDWREREAELKSEIAFLRALVEGHGRSEAELRQLVSDALKKVPQPGYGVEAYAPLDFEDLDKGELRL